MKRLILILGLAICYLGCFSQKTGTFTDKRDGKVYRTVRIGNQWVMAENLAYKPKSGSCYAYKNDTSNVRLFGYLYDWETATKVETEGWHLPSIEEWEKLYNFLGGNFEVVRAALSRGGSTGFNLALGGTRNLYGFSDLGKVDAFWSSTRAWDFYIYSSKNVQMDITQCESAAPRKCGCSVRLFKDLNEIDTWDWAKTTDPIQGFTEYLKLYPAGVHADSARQLLTELKDIGAKQISTINSKLVPGLSLEEVISLLSMEEVINRNIMGGLYVGMGIFPQNANEKSSYTGNASIDGYDIVFEKGKVVSTKIITDRIGSKKASFSSSF